LVENIDTHHRLGLLNGRITRPQAGTNNPFVTGHRRFDQSPPIVPILSGQGDFQNNTSGPLGYDGIDTPMALVQVIDRERSTVSSIELFTDGYFETAETPAVAAWEASFREVERSDPDKIDRYPSPKGSTASGYADDRTVIVIHRH